MSDATARALFPVLEALAAALGARVPEPWDRNPRERWVRWWIAWAAYRVRLWRRRREGVWVPGGKPYPRPPLGPRRYTDPTEGL